MARVAPADARGRVRGAVDARARRHHVRLWQLGSLTIPISSAGDNATALSSIKTLDEIGTYQHNPRLGWPVGQDLYDFAANGADNLHTSSCSASAGS